MSLNYSKWDWQVSSGHHSQRRRQQIYGAIRRKCLGEIFHDLGRPGESKIVEAPVLGPYPHVCAHSTQVSGVQCDRTPQRKKCDPNCKGLHGKEADFHRGYLLDTRILPLPRGIGRRGDHKVHPLAAGRRSTPRTAQHAPLRDPPSGEAHEQTPMEGLTKICPQLCRGSFNGRTKWEKTWNVSV